MRWNPVGLAYIKKSLLYSEWVPPISLDLNPVLDVEKRANDKLHQNISDINDGSDVEQSIEDFVIKPSLGMDGGQGNYAAIAKTRYFVIGGAVHSPSRVLADIGVSGTKFRAATNSNGGTTIRLLGILSGTMSSEIKISGYSLALAKLFLTTSGSVSAWMIIQPLSQLLVYFNLKLKFLQVHRNSFSIIQNPHIMINSMQTPMAFLKEVVRDYGSASVIILKTGWLLI